MAKMTWKQAVAEREARNTGGNAASVTGSGAWQRAVSECRNAEMGNHLRRIHIMDWKKKLTSRKFWLAVVGFITPLLLAFGVAEADVTQVTAIIMAGADVLAYILAEGMVDAKSAAAETISNDLPY